MTNGLLPAWAQRKLIEAAEIKDAMQRRIEIDRVTAAVRMERPELFKGGDDGDDQSCGCK